MTWAEAEAVAQQLVKHFSPEQVDKHFGAVRKIQGALQAAREADEQRLRRHAESAALETEAATRRTLLAELDEALVSRRAAHEAALATYAEEMAGTRTRAEAAQAALQVKTDALAAECARLVAERDRQQQETQRVAKERRLAAERDHAGRLEQLRAEREVAEAELARIHADLKAVKDRIIHLA